MQVALPRPPSWYPGHMAAFAKALPSLLANTNVVLEVRDSRLPLTSINHALEEQLEEWHSNVNNTGTIRERIVVHTKRDLVPNWGEEVSCVSSFTTYPYTQSVEPRDFVVHYRNIINIICISPRPLHRLPLKRCIPLSYVRLPVFSGAYP